MTVVRRVRALPTWLLPLVALGLLIAAPVVGVDDVTQRQIVLIATLTLIVSGFNLAFGYGGELAVGQVAMYAIGAYVGGIMLVHKYDVLLALGASMLAAAAVGAVTAIPGLRLGGWGLAMASFFLVLLIPDVTDIFRSQTGGLVGLTGVPIPKLAGHPLDNHAFYLLVLAVTGAWFVVMRNLVLSRHGAALLVLRQSSILAESLGISVYRLKLAAYALGSAPAGLAGTLLVARDRFVAPEYFTLQAAISIIAASILGGSQSIYGAVLGAAILIIGPSQSTFFQQYAYVVYGIILLAGIFVSDGIGAARRWTGGRLDAWIPTAAAAPVVVGDVVPFTLAGEPLVVSSIVKKFAGVTALNDVSLTARPGAVTGLIGANGSGKTTCLNVVTGFYRADRGTVHLGERVLTGRGPSAIARIGVARTFQTPLIPDRLSTVEVVASARYVKDYVGFVAAVLRLPRFVRARQRDIEEAHRILRSLGLEDLADRPASSLPLGSRRLVEVARAMAARPAAVLLDEPASGLDEDEVRRLSRVIDGLRRSGATVVLVEHNFAMVCEVADYIYALDFGAIIAEGPPARIRSDDKVISSYLGTPHPAAVAE